MSFLYALRKGKPMIGVIKRIVKYMLVILTAVFVVNLFNWFFIDGEEVLIYISPYAGKNLDILNREQATKIVSPELLFCSRINLKTEYYLMILN